MGKEKITLEYVFEKASKSSLWNQIATPTGLSDWFADDVSIRGDNYVFTWNKVEQEATLLSLVQLSHIRLQWEEEEDYFEFRIHRDELTGAIALEVIDFVDRAEKEDTVTLWEAQIKDLRRSLGL